MIALMSLHLLADIGGTSSRLALAEGATLRADSLRRYDNDAAGTPEDLLRRYVGETGARPVAACIAAAGPVAGDAVQLTNRAWHITRAQVAAATGAAKIVLLNDLQAMGYALAAPGIAGSKLTRTRLVLALGTGSNAAVAHATPAGIFVPPGEHGYLTLPFTTLEDIPLLAALAQDFGAPVIETALSGAGLSRLHRVLAGESRPPQDITAPAPGCEASLAAALRLLGATLGSLALIHLPYGGIYLAGSVGRALYPHLSDPGFRRHFGSRGAYSDLVASMPLRLIEDDGAALHGAALCLEQVSTG